MKKQNMFIGMGVIILLVAFAAGVWAAWYSYGRYAKIAHNDDCSRLSASTAPGAFPPCVYEIVPPTLWEKLTGQTGGIQLPAYLSGGCDQSATTTDCALIIAQNPASSPTALMAGQVIVADAHPTSPPPAGFRAMKDVQLNITFNAPEDWEPQYLPEGDGHASVVSPDFSNPLGTMTGALLHYYFQSPPDQFAGHPDQYMALLKQGMIWTQTSLDGHIAYLATPAKGYTMVVSEFSGDSFLTVAFKDTTGAYSAVFDEFLRSFHMQ